MRSRGKLEITMPGSSLWMPCAPQGVQGLDDNDDDDDDDDGGGGGGGDDDDAVLVIRVHGKIVRRFRNRKSIAMRHRPNC